MSSKQKSKTPNGRRGKKSKPLTLTDMWKPKEITPKIVSKIDKKVLKTEKEKCTPIAKKIRQCEIPKIDIASEEEVRDRMPWIEKYKIVKKSNLAVDHEALEKVESWLKAWKNDIKDGKSRKFLQKRKRRDSESDFVTSDEEESELKTKCLVLFGPTGCGKGATVSTLAKKMEFKVVEVNFSSARPGKEVLKRVEEATLSHRLESKQTCLLLFKDICLVEPIKDEGFAAAVAQLITTSCRPIIMTMTLPSPSGSLPPVAGDCDSLILDAKIEKKEPFCVYFVPQPASVIVQKALVPIVKSEFPSLDTEGDRELTAFLYIIARHCKGDVRQSVNQLQFYLPMYNSRPTICKFHQYLSPHIDLDFVRRSQRHQRQCTQEKSETNRRSRINSKNDTPLPSLPPVPIVNLENGEGGQVEGMEVIGDPSQNSENKKSKELVQDELKSLNSLVQGLNFAVDLDRVTTFLQCRSHHQEISFEDDLKSGRHHFLMNCFTDSIQQYCHLTGQSGGRSSTPQLSKEFLSDITPSPAKKRKRKQNSIIVPGDTESEASSDDNGVNHCTERTKSFELSSFMLDDDEDVARTRKVKRLTADLGEYCNVEGDLMASGQFNYHDFALVRTIIKTNKLNSVHSNKRNRRGSSYFNRLSADLVDRVYDTFDFRNDLSIAKQST